MRLGLPARHVTSFDAGDACPCCFGALDRVKRAMGAVSRSMAQSLPTVRDEGLETALATLRSEGRTVFHTLEGALQGLAAAPDVTGFGAAIMATRHAIDQRAPAPEGGEGEALMALGTALRELGEALALLTSELRANREEAWRRPGRPTLCEYVDDQQKGVDLRR